MKKFIIPAIFMPALVLMLVTSCSDSGKKEVKEHGLKDHFNGIFLVGAALNGQQIMGEDSLAQEFIVKHFNTITAENAMKWERIHPRPDEYNFVLADSMIAQGMRNDMFIVGRCLLYHSQTPD